MQLLTDTEYTVKQVLMCSAASCGSGKTTWAVNRMAQAPARYIYAVDRTDEFEARESMIRKAAALAGTAPIIRRLSSLDKSQIVRRDYPEMMDSFGHLDHVIMIVTHEALKVASHRFAKGWTLIIDEDPKMWSSESLDLGASEPFWSANYNLKPIADMEGYAVIEARPDCPSFQQMSSDVMTAGIAGFHNRVISRAGVTDDVSLSGRIVVNLTDWDDLAERNRMAWFRIWDITELAEYDAVYILANAFDRLISARLIESLFPTVSMMGFEIGRAQAWAPRSVQINYVAGDHRAGSSFFKKTEEGREAVRLWAEWAAGRVDAADHFWSANKDTAIELPGERISPKIAGSNRYRNLHQVSVLYTAKAGNVEDGVFSALSGGVISRDDVMRDREYEDLIQIVFRSSLRMPEDASPVTLNVYDRDQADFLKDYFEVAFPTFDITTHHHDIGIVRTMQKAGRKPVGAKAMTSAERMRRKRALAKVSAKLKGGK